MPYNGSGVFTQIYNWVTDKANNVLVTASRFQSTYDDMATAFSNCITRDGQSPPSNDIPMGGFKLTDLADGAIATDAATVGQIQTTAVYVSSNSNFPIASGVAEVVPILGTASIFDVLSEWNAANSRVVVDKAGYYWVTGSVWVINGAGTTMNVTKVQLFLVKNGVTLHEVLTSNVPFSVVASDGPYKVPFSGAWESSVAIADTLSLKATITFTGGSVNPTTGVTALFRGIIS